MCATARLRADIGRSRDREAAAAGTGKTLGEREEKVNMLIDSTLRITPKMAADAQGNEKRALTGRLLPGSPGLPCSHLRGICRGWHSKWENREGG